MLRAGEALVISTARHSAVPSICVDHPCQSCDPWYYAWLAAHEEEKSHIMELVREGLSFEEKGNAMRVAGMLLRESRRQGLQKGLEKGSERGKREVARNLPATGLSRQKLTAPRKA
ncbi:MAG: hypothetical protein AAF471_07345 [Myxococcota bacterium]